MPNYRKEVVNSKYNLFEWGKREGLTNKDLVEYFDVKCATNLYNYRNNKLGAALIRKIDQIFENSVDNPEEYLWENCPFQPTKAGGRKKQAPVKHIKVKDLSLEEKQHYGIVDIQKKEFKALGRTRINLITVEDIFMTLAKGERIYQEDSSYSYQMLIENGSSAIIKYRDNEPVFLSPSLDLAQSFYYYEKEQLQIQVGKTYISRNNEEVMIISGAGNDFKGVIIGNPTLLSYNVNGIYQSDDLDNLKDNSKDLMGEKY